MAQETTMRTSPCRVTPYRATPYHVMRTLAAAAPLAVLLLATPGRAAPTVYYHAGAWHAFTDKDEQGAGVCGIATENQSDGRNLTLTYTIGGTDLTFTAAKPSWNIPEGSILEANMQIDGNPAWQAQGTGHGTTLVWVVGAADVRNFNTQLRNGSTMTLTFPSGNEPPWSLSLRGSSAASATLWRCVQDLTDRAKAAGTYKASSAPTGNAPGTQPYGQAPTQPYAPPAAPTAAPANGAAAPTNGAPAQSTVPANGTATQPTAPADGSSPQTPPSTGGTPPPATKP
jgi:hypothetical protein